MKNMKKWIYSILPIFLLAILVSLAVFLPHKISDYFDSHMFNKLHAQSIPETSLPNPNSTLSVTDRLSLIRRYGLDTNISRSHSGTYINNKLIDTDDSLYPIASAKSPAVYYDEKGNISVSSSYGSLLDEASEKFQNYLDGKTSKTLDTVNEELIEKVKQELVTLSSHEIIPEITEPENLSILMFNCFTYTNINNMDEYVCICYFKFTTNDISVDILYDMDAEQIYQCTLYGKFSETNFSKHYLESKLDEDVFQETMKKGMCNYLNISMAELESHFHFNSYTSLSDSGELYGSYSILLND